MAWIDTLPTCLSTSSQLLTCTVSDDSRVQEGEGGRGEGTGTLLQGLYLWAAITALWFGRCHSRPFSFSLPGGFSSLEGSSDHLLTSPLIGRHLSPALDWGLGLRSPYLHSSLCWDPTSFRQPFRIKSFKMTPG